MCGDGPVLLIPVSKLSVRPGTLSCSLLKMGSDKIRFDWIRSDKIRQGLDWIRLDKIRFDWIRLDEIIDEIRLD